MDRSDYQRQIEHLRTFSSILQDRVDAFEGGYAYACKGKPCDWVAHDDGILVCRRCKGISYDKVPKA